MYLLCICCGADKSVDSANNLSVMRVSSVTAKDNEGDKEAKITDTTKVTILLPELQTCM